MGFRLASGIAAALFAYALFVQFDDVDRVRWMLLYGAAATVSLLRALESTKGAALPPLVAVAAVVWAAVLAPQTGHAEGIDAVELWREIGGLLLVGLWMGWIWRKGFEEKNGDEA